MRGEYTDCNDDDWETSWFETRGESSNYICSMSSFGGIDNAFDRRVIVVSVVLGDLNKKIRNNNPNDSTKGKILPSTRIYIWIQK